MSVPFPRRASYDHRLRAEVVRSKNVALAIDLGVPRSTASSWLARGVPANVVTFQATTNAEDAFELRLRIRRLERRVRVLVVAVMLLRLSRRLDRDSKASGAIEASTKAAVLRAAERARSVMPRRSALALLGISSGRLRAWQARATQCRLDDSPSCPRSQPARLTTSEVRAMRDLVLSEAHRAFPIRGLALHAARIGSVFASPTTWARTIRARGWTRPSRRIHPRPSRLGLRTSSPNEAWHVDVTVVKLLDGTKVFVQSVMDNFSRKVLAHRVSSRIDPSATAELLRAAAARYLPSGTSDPPAVDLICDAGIENLNRHVDAVLPDLGLRRVLAQVDVDHSNSLIEAFWRSLKHRWLFLHALASVDIVRGLVDRYVELHNTELPHSAFRGRTPDEVFAGEGVDIEQELGRRHQEARTRRLEENRRARCGGCRQPDGGRTGHSRTLRFPPRFPTCRSCVANRSGGDGSEHGYELGHRFLPLFVDVKHPQEIRSGGLFRSRFAANS